VFVSTAVVAVEPAGGNELSEETEAVSAGDEGSAKPIEAEKAVCCSTAAVFFAKGQALQ
jgi:hypothetical protein